MEHTTLVDRIAMGLSAALLLGGTVVLGVVETVAGKPYAPAPLTNEAGDVVATPLVDPTLRTGLVLAGLAVLALYGLYRLLQPVERVEDATGTELTAD